MFDPISPAVVAANHTVSMILRPDRAARMVAQKAVDPALPGLADVLDQLVSASFDVETTGTYEAELSRAVERLVAERIMRLAETAPMAQVRAVASLKLGDLRDRLALTVNTGTVADQAHHTLLAQDIQRFLDRPADSFAQPEAPPEPPGAPIGDTGLEYLIPDPQCSVWWY